MRKILTSLAVTLIGFLSSAQAVMLVGWDLPGSTANTNVAAGSAATGVVGGNMYKDVGLTPDTASAARWQYSSFNQTNTDNSAMVAALAGNDSISFSLTASTGYSLTVRGIGPASFYRSGSGPRFQALLYSTNLNFSNYSVVATSTMGVAGTSITTDFSTNAAWTNFVTPITVAEGTTGYFRFVGYGSTGTGGTGGFTAGSTVDFSLMGDVNSLGMYTWAGGSGAWVPGVAANWQSGGASANWINGKDVNFASGGDLAVDAAGVTAGALSYSGATAVTLTGGAIGASSIAGATGSTLNLNGGAATVSGNVDLQDATINGGSLGFGGVFGVSISTGSTTVGTALSGNGSLAKIGAGELILSRTNTYSGGTSVGAGTLTTGASEVLSDTANLVVAANATFKLGGNETVGGLNAVFGSFINLQGNTLTAGGNNSSFTNGATITGTGGLVKNGTGQMYFNNNTNTFSGGFILNSGEVAYTSSGVATNGVISNTVFGLGTVRLNGGSFGSSSSSSGRNLHNSVILNGNIQFGQTAWGSSTTNLNGGIPNLTVTTNGAGTTTLADNSTINTIGSVQWDQAISGNFRLTKTGTGPVGLSNNFLTLRASNNIAGVTVLSGSLGFKNRNSLGTGTLILADGVVVGQDGAINNTVVGTDSVDRSIPNGVRLDGNVTFGLGGTATYLGGNIDLNGANRTVTLGNTTYMFGQITNGGLVVDNGSASGSRALWIYGNSTHSSGTVVRTNAILAVGHDNALGSGNLIFTNNGVGAGIASLRAATLSTDASQVRTITNNIVLDQGMTVSLETITSVVVASNTSSVNLDMTLAGDISGAGALNKTNGRAVKLTGNNTYTGGTTVSLGTLIVEKPAFTATITTNSVDIVVSNNATAGSYAVLPTPSSGSALTGTYPAANITGLNTNNLRSASFSPTTGSLTVVAKSSQTITFNSLPAKAFGDSAFALSALSDSGLPVSYSSSNPRVATVSGSTVTIVGVGSTVITASQAGSADYRPASSVTQTLTVNDSARPVYGTTDSQNFEGFTTADLLDSANGWSTDDAYVDPAGTYANGFRPDAGGGIAASIGGWITAAPQYRMKYQFAPGTSDRLVFTWKQNIESSADPALPAPDRFGWEFRSGTNALFSLKMIQYVDSNNNGTWDKTDETTDPVTPAEPLAGDNATLLDQPGGSTATLVTSNVVVAGYTADGTRLTTADQPNFAVVARDQWQEFRVIVDLRAGRWWAQVYSGGAFQNLMGDAGVALPAGTTTVDSITALWELNDTTPTDGVEPTETWDDTYEMGGSNQMLFDDLSIQGRRIVHLGMSVPSGAIYNGSAQGATTTDESTGTAQVTYSLLYSGVTNTTVPVNYGTYIATAGINTNTTPYFAVVGTNAARLYTNSATITQQYAIDRKSVTITNVGVADKIYNGTTSATITGTPVIDGKVTGDNVSVAGGTANFTSAEAGPVKLATISGYTLTGTAASNYLLTGMPISASAEISQKTLNVTAQAKTKVYGANDPAFTYTSSGLVGSDAISGDLDRMIGENVGTYAIGLGTLSAGANYSISYVGADLTIGVATLGIAADPQSKSYNDPDPILSYVVTGLVNGDTEAGVISGALDRALGEGIGSYAINQGTLDAGLNYVISFTGEDLTINPASVPPGSITLTEPPSGLTYDSTPKEYFVSSALTSSFSVIYDGILATSYGPNTTAPTNAGTYRVTATITDPNYAAASESVDFIITQSAQTISGVTATNTKTYGDPSYNLGATTDSFLGLTYASDNTAVATVDASGEVTIVGAGVAVITVSQIGDTNYAPASDVNQTLTVAKANPVIDSNPSASPINLGQALSSSTLTGGSATGVDGNPLAGGFAFTDTTEVPGATGNYSASVTFTPTDGDNYNPVTTNVDVTVNTATTPAEDYLASFGLTGANAALTADPDGDGLNNAQEFAFGAVPNVAGSLPITTSNTGGSLKMVFLGRTNGITYNVLSYTNLRVAAVSTNAPTASATQPTNLPAGYKQYEATVDSSTATRKFMKVDAVIP